jgi:hypothetical protein
VLAVALALAGLAVPAFGAAVFGADGDAAVFGAVPMFGAAVRPALGVALFAAPLAVALADAPLPAGLAGVDDEAPLLSLAGAAAEVFTAGSTSSGRESRVDAPRAALSPAGACDGAEVFTPGSTSCGRGVSRAGGTPCAHTSAGDASSAADTNSNIARKVSREVAMGARSLAHRARANGRDNVAGTR